MARNQSVTSGGGLGKDAYIGLGSNIEPRVRHLMHSAHLISLFPDTSIVDSSSVYTAAAHTLDRSPQPDFLNAVLRLRTRLPAEELLMHCLAVETVMGRVRASSRWLPRVIDIDVLIFGDEQLQSDQLTIPHPRLAHRLFVLEPLSEVWPSGSKLPGLDRTVDVLRAECTDLLPPVKTIITLRNYGESRRIF